MAQRRVFTDSSLSLLKNKAKAAVRKFNPTTASSPQAALATCNNSTYFMRLKAAAGEKIEVVRVSILPGNQYLVAGNYRFADGHTEGILFLLDNMGTILLQKKLQVQNRPIKLQDIVTTSAGNIFIAGYFQDGAPEEFVSALDATLNTIWLKILPLAEAPSNVKLDIGEFDQLLIAAAITNAVHYAAIEQDGTIYWSRKVGLTGFDELVGFHQSMFGQYSLILNATQSGKPAIQMIDISPTDGSVIKSSFTGDGTEGFHALASSGYNYRIMLSAWRDKNTANRFPIRDIIANADYNETRHSYTFPWTMDGNTSSAVDRAGDAIGYFLPASQELVFLKHFAYYQIEPEFSKKYTVTNGRDIRSITRSYDGGYLFGMNAVDSGEIILLKTDSLGTLPACGSTTVNVGYTEEYNTATISAGYSTLVAVTGSSTGTAQIQSTGLSPAFDCKELICPPAPLEDTCLTTYNKYFRTGSYAEVISDYFLMQGNNHIWSEARLERLFGVFNEVTYLLKLLNEKGDVIKAVGIYDDRSSQPMSTFKLSDTRLLLLGNASTGADQAISIHLVDDNLNLLWKKTIIPSIYIYSQAGGFSDAHMDAEGNIYLVGTRAGYLNDSSTVIVHKMDGNGNPLWSSCYKTKQGYFGTASITTSSQGVHVAIEVGSANNVSVHLSKSTGQLLNASTFPLQWDNSVLTRKIFYSEGRLYLAGSNHQSDLAIAKFDTTGRVLQIREITQNLGSLPRNSTMRDGYLYVNFMPFYNSQYGNSILKMDSNLDIRFLNFYNLERFGSARGIQVSPQHYIYEAGTNFYGGVNSAYGDPYLIKRDSLGNLGTCGFEVMPDLFNRTTPAPGTIDFRLGNISFRDSINTTFLLVDTLATNISAIRCSSAPQCTKLEIADLPPVCKWNTDIVIPYTKNAGCTLKPSFQVDTSIVKIQKITDTTIVVQFKKNGTAHIVGLLNTGCSFYADSIDILIQNMQNVLEIGNDTLLCPGDTLKLNARKGFYSYTWQDGSTDSIFIVRSPGKYYVTISNSCGDLSSDTILIGQVNVPVLTLGPDRLECFGDSITLQATAGFQTYTWTPAGIIRGAGAQVRTRPLHDTSYTVLAQTVEGCKSYDTLYVSLKYPLAIDIGKDTGFCASDSITLRAGNGFINYLWSTGAATPDITVKLKGTYSVAALNNNGCYSKDTLKVYDVYALPVIDLGADRSICENSTITLNPGNFQSYLWQDNSTNPSFTVRDIGWYKVQVSDINGCKAIDSINIPVKDPAPAGFLNQIDTLCSYDKLDIVPKQTYNSYTWSTGNTTGRITVTTGGWYSLAVTDPKGCKGIDSILIVEKQCLSGMFLPNAFTPNRDGRNDVFKAKAYGPLVFFELNIYNRYGQLVFSTKDANKGWDGTINGLPVDNGNFAWTCSYQFVGREKEFQRGFVLVLR